MLNSKEFATIKKYSGQHPDKQEASIVFMNDGYCPLDVDGFPVENLNIPADYKMWRYQVSMYKKVLELAGIKENCGKLLEVSCGYGAGLSFIERYYNYDELYGLDINPIHIKHCKYHFSNINFITGSATNIPINDIQFDFIISIEACSYYNPITLFLKECNRLLKDDGVLIIASASIPEQLPFEVSKLEILETVDISKNVHIASAISKYNVPLKSCRETIHNDQYNLFFASKPYVINAYRKKF